MNESERERIIDKRVQRRLNIDPAYRNAANAEEQAEREQEITEDEEVRLLRQELGIYPSPLGKAR